MKHTGPVQAFTVVNTERRAKRKKKKISRQEVKEIRNRESNNPRPVNVHFQLARKLAPLFSFFFFFLFLRHVAAIHKPRGQFSTIGAASNVPPSLLPFSPFKTGNVPVLCQMGSPFFFVPPPPHSRQKKKEERLAPPLSPCHLSQTPQLSRTVQQKPPHCASALPRICTSTKDSTWAPCSPAPRLPTHHSFPPVSQPQDHKKTRMAEWRNGGREGKNFGNNSLLANPSPLAMPSIFSFPR